MVYWRAMLRGLGGGRNLLRLGNIKNNNQSWAFATFFPFRYSLLRYFSEICNTLFAIRYSLFATSFEQCNRLYISELLCRFVDPD
jgi:hypothetical protein